jgi:serine/threonine-protein kinase
LVSRDLGTVKITDFGIATLAEELFDEVIAKNGDLTRSTSGTIKGALPFMAPEMIFRKSGDKVGMQADVWSLGALLFRLMTGEFPFGEGMMVPVNVEKKKPLRWPAFIRVNPQYAPLAESLISIAELCLNHDKDARPTASQLVAMCEDICFQFGSRQSGEIVSINGSKGLIKSDSGKSIFYHFDSVYGKLPPRLNAPVTFSIHPGTPHPRAHPVIVCS